MNDGVSLEKNIIERVNISPKVLSVVPIGSPVQSASRRLITLKQTFNCIFSINRVFAQLRHLTGVSTETQEGFEMSIVCHQKGWQNPVERERY